MAHFKKWLNLESQQPLLRLRTPNLLFVIVTIFLSHNSLSFSLIFFYWFHVSCNYTLISSVTVPYLQLNPGLITSYLEHLSCWLLSLTPSSLQFSFLKLQVKEQGGWYKGDNPRQHQVSVIPPREGVKCTPHWLCHRGTGAALPSESSMAQGSRELQNCPFSPKTHTTSREIIIEHNQMNQSKGRATASLFQVSDSANSASTGWYSPSSKRAS